MTVALTPTRFDADQALAQFARARGDAGALASFVGYCRRLSHGEAVERLELLHYPGFTEKTIAEMAAATTRRHQLIDVLVIHRVGAIEPGEPIVLVAALSAHRAAAFAAVEELMDLLKTDAPIWKQQFGPEGGRWIEPTDVDRARRAARKERTS
jgi:molybdopterin synthase catalytic subunit